MESTISIPIELVEQFERDNVLLFAGEGVKRGCLPSLAELAQELGQRCDYPPGEPLTFPRVAGYYELVRDRNSLITFLRDRLDIESLQPSQAHELIAQLEPRPQTIVTTCYDRLLEQALRQTDIPYVAVVGNEDVAFAEERKTLLVWMWGVLDQPDSLVITEDDQRTFLENRGNLSDVLRGELARRTWLFLGFDVEDEWFRGFYDTVHRGLDRYVRRSYVFGATPGDYTRLWWEKRNVSILETRVTQFLKALEEQLKQRRQLAAGVQPRPIRPTAEVSPAPIPGSPYKRLDYYGENDRPLFFGRDQEIERLAALIHAHRLVLLYGASGTGKTSLLRAGVIPRLRYSDPGYIVIPVRALEDVRVSIRNAIARQMEGETFTPDESLVKTLAKVTEELGPIVLVIDQFEEFFVHFEAETRRQIIDELAALYEAQDVPVKIVFSVREDYLARMGELEARLVEIFRVRFQLQPLAPAQARQTIIRPVEAMGKSYEPALVDRLLADLTDEGVMPPQLQLVCSTLYDELPPDDRQITLARYEELGGAAGILKTYLAGELARLAGPERTLARGILKELIDSQGNKRVGTEEDLVRALGVTPVQLKPVLEKLVRSHLVRPLDLEQRGETGYELAHEYLAYEIMGWFDPQESERKRVYELLRQDVDRWQQFQTPIAGPTLDLIAPHWDDILLQPEERTLILRSAVQRGWNVEEWVERMGSEPGSAELLQEFLHAPEEATRHNAVRAWRYMPADSAGDEGLAEVALSDPLPAIRTEAAVSLAQRDPKQGVDLILNRTEAGQPRRVEVLAHIWDETAPLRQLPTGWRLPVILALGRIRLKQSGRALLYHSVAGVVGGIVTGLLFGLIVSPIHWMVDKLAWETAGFSLQAVIAAWLIMGPWFASALGTVMILSSTITLALLKQPKRRWVLLSSALLAGLFMSLSLGIIYQGNFLRGALWQACFNGFVIGSLMGGSVAELFYRRQASGSMPSPLIAILLGIGIGLIAGIITSFFPQRHDIFVSWLTGITVGSTLILGGVNLAVKNADRFMAGLSPEESKGGWFK
jgi:KaiC/GvpD/RAD55 family RecA-like ATPase